MHSHLPPKERKHSWDTPHSRELPPQQGWEHGQGWSLMSLRCHSPGGLGGTQLWVPVVSAQPRWTPGEGWMWHGGLQPVGEQEQWLGQEIMGLGCPEGDGAAGELC